MTCRRRRCASPRPGPRAARRPARGRAPACRSAPPGNDVRAAACSSSASLVRKRAGCVPIGALDVLLDELLEFLGDALALQRRALFAVDVDRRDRSLAGAGQADADVGVLALARTVDDATHDGDGHL